MKAAVTEARDPAGLQARRLRLPATEHRGRPLTLQKIRSGGTQTVVVQHVNVGDGGQAMVAGEVKEPPILLWFLLLQLSRSRVQLVSNLTQPPRGLSVHFIGQLPKALSARPKGCGGHRREGSGMHYQPTRKQTVGSRPWRKCGLVFREEPPDRLHHVGSADWRGHEVTPSLLCTFETRVAP